MMKKAGQECYPDQFNHCYGCGQLNEQGFQIKSYWENGECTCTFKPRPYHTAVPGYAYGGLIASLIDCHGIGTAAAAAHVAAGGEIGTETLPRFVTASLQVDYLRPTPIDAILELRAKPVEVKERKVVVEVTLSAEGSTCAKGKVLAVRLPENFGD